MHLARTTLIADPTPRAAALGRQTLWTLNRQSTETTWLRQGLAEAQADAEVLNDILKSAGPDSSAALHEGGLPGHVTSPADCPVT